MSDEERQAQTRKLQYLVGMRADINEMIDAISEEADCLDEADLAVLRAQVANVRWRQSRWRQ